MEALEAFTRATGMNRTQVIEDAIILHLTRLGMKPSEAVYGKKEEDHLA